MGCLQGKYKIEIQPNVIITNARNQMFSLKTIITKEEIKINNSNHIVQKKSNVESQYKILEELGKGSFGSVYRVVNKDSGIIRAMKIIKKETIKYQDDSRTFLKEIEILIKIDHPNIIKMFEYFVDTQNYYLITEFISGGELYESIVKWKSFSEKKANYIFKQLLSAVNYLHSMNIVHRDLKPENILVLESKKDAKGKEKEKEKEIYHIKLIDFGTCNYIDKGTTLSMKVGTPYYIAPEVINKKYNEKCDLWSCGVILYVILVGFPPFNGKDSKEIFENVLKGKYNIKTKEWKSVSDEAKDLLEKLLTLDYNNRWSANQCLEHDLIKSYSFENDNVETKHLTHALANMRNFHIGEKLQQATLAYIVHSSSLTKEIEELKRVFNLLDSNGDGRLNYNEIKSGFEKVFGSQFSELEMGNILKKIDNDFDGFIGYEEFLRATIDSNNLLSEENIKTAFKQFDYNGDGKLSIDELKAVLGTSDDYYVKELLKQIDSNNDGSVSLAEFMVLMKAIISDKKISKE